MTLAGIETKILKNTIFFGDHLGFFHRSSIRFKIDLMPVVHIEALKIKTIFLKVRSLPPPPAWAQGEESSPPKPVDNGSPTPPVAKTPTNHPDDIPIKAGNQANMRTFEELLSQELRVNR